MPPLHHSMSSPTNAPAQTLAIRAMEKYTRDVGGYQCLYADTFMSRAEFREMFNHELYDRMRLKVGVLGYRGRGLLASLGQGRPPTSSKDVTSPCIPIHANPLSCFPGRNSMTPWAPFPTYTTRSNRRRGCCWRARMVGRCSRPSQQQPRPRRRNSKWRGKRGFVACDDLCPGRD